jgi:uncharacterized protein (TIGR00375 family)
LRIFADLHLHSKYSRATSDRMNATDLAEAAKVKGVNLLGTGDFTHPEYLEELKTKLTNFSDGFYEHDGVHFVLSAEVSSIYSQGGRQRRIHQLILAPDFESVDSINSELLKRGRLDYDGRPIFGLTAPEIIDLCTDACEKCMVIPAHIWTPWYSVYGSNSGFDSMKECYGDSIKHIHAIETGLSSDPAMNWRLSELDDFTILSNSDSHSPWPWRLGRECNVFELKKMSYHEMKNVIEEKDTKKLLYTVEVDPSYGKYHYDGHRNCNVSLSPEEAKKYNNICPVCRKPLTIGVLHRVEELADRPEGFKPKDAVPFKTLVPLSELIAAAPGRGMATQTVWKEFDSLTSSSASELDVLLEMPESELLKRTDEKTVDLVLRNRNGTLKIKPGYDGVYGEIMLDEARPAASASQKTLADF